MASSEILHDFSPTIRVYKDGRIERPDSYTLPASVDPMTGVQSKDVKIVKETGLSVRVYIPKAANSDHKLPLLVYFHGGGFVSGSVSLSAYHSHLNSLVAQANIIAVSVEYRLAPEYPLPIAYEDSWAAIKWVVSHCSEGGQEAWLKEYVDFQRLFFAGDSAGGNIAHNMAMRVGLENLGGVKLDGIALMHPYFWGEEPMGIELVEVSRKATIDRLWPFVNPSSSGLDDPALNPALDSKICSLGCKRVLVCAAEKDVVKDRGWYYKEVLDKSAWGGKVDVVEVKGEDHVFHLIDPTSDNAVALLKSLAVFINKGEPM